MARLRTFVHVHGEAETRVFGPDDEVPPEWATRITNPACWDGPPPEPVDAADIQPPADPPPEIHPDADRPLVAGPHATPEARGRKRQ
jgi:hypothetical protein